MEEKSLVHSHDVVNLITTGVTITIIIIIIVNHSWVFVEHDIQQLKYKEENCRILKRDKQFHPVPITFTDCRKEVEVTYNILINI